MIATIEWDTATVLTVILAPLCVVFVGIIFVQWQRINELKHDEQAGVKKVAELEKAVADGRIEHTRSLTDTSTQKDAEIQRLKKEIEMLRNEMSTMAANREREARLHQAASHTVLPSENIL
jgi:cell division protein FtsB